MARLYRTVGGEIVKEGHPNAAFLVVADGRRVPPQYAEAVAEYRASGPDGDKNASNESGGSWSELPEQAETPKPRKRAAKKAAARSDD